MSVTRLSAIVFMICGLILSGCLRRADTVTPSPVATSIPATATVAFPTLIPTSTFTPKPTGSPTPDISSRPGSVIFRDTFSGTMQWVPVELAPGGLSLSAERLVISVRQPNSLFMALSPAEPVQNAYVEVEVRPELCLDQDEFGLVFRANDAFEHYRFTLTCQGEARVIGVIEGSERVLVPNTTSMTIFPGLLRSNILGVLMENELFRFYINGEEVFADRDRGLTAGWVGLAVRARQSGQTTASFDDFAVYMLQPVPTSTPLE